MVNTQTELWKAVEGHERYLVSNQGRVHGPFGIRKLLVSDRGYNIVSWKVNGRCKTFKVHRLVAKAFCENPHDYVEINHKDGNKFNNEASNLEWCSRSDNLAHAWATGLR